MLVDEDGKRSTEIKGLDMKRREYSALSKNVSNYVLDQILSGQATELVVEHIHEYLSDMSTKIKSGQVALDDFIIYKRLGKNPEDYPDVKSQTARAGCPTNEVPRRKCANGRCDPVHLLPGRGWQFEHQDGAGGEGAPSGRAEEERQRA